jgi:hypothetical protein
MKNGIYIAQAQVQYANYLALKKKIDILEAIVDQKQIKSLKNQLKRSSKTKQKLTLCIDIENVLLAEIDLNDKHDLKKLQNCKERSKNYLIIKKDGFSGEPNKCV